MNHNLQKLFALIFLLTSFQASAHYLWIKLSAPVTIGKEQEVRIYYGEFNEGVREVKGGRLEELSGIQAWVITPNGKQIPLTVTTESKFFRAAFTPQEKGKYVIVAVNTVREVVDWSQHEIGIVHPVYYTTREVIIGTKENIQLTNLPQEAELSISSVDGKKNSFTVAYKGKPLANAKVLFHAPNEWSKELKTDATGIVTFDPLWTGQYIVECIHTEKVAGNYKGKTYQAVRHRATLSTEIQ